MGASCSGRDVGLEVESQPLSRSCCFSATKFVYVTIDLLRCLRSARRRRRCASVSSLSTFLDVCPLMTSSNVSAMMKRLTSVGIVKLSPAAAAWREVLVNLRRCAGDRPSGVRASGTRAILSSDLSLSDQLWLRNSRANADQRRNSRKPILADKLLSENNTRDCEK